MRTVLCTLAIVLGLGEARAGQDKGKPDPDRIKGMKAAVADIEKGVLKLFLPPAPAPLSQLEYAKLLKKECGVEATAAGFGPTEGGEKANGGYNDVMRAEIEHRFGEGILDRLRARAEKLAEAGDGKAVKKQPGPPWGAEVFVHPEKLTAKDKLTDGKTGTAIEIKSETTLVWIDLVPGARHGHPTEYVLISADGTRVVTGTWWPVLNGKDLFRDGKAYKQEFPVTVSGAADKPVKVEKKWDALSTSVNDNDLWKKVPKCGVVAGPKEWATLWKAWFGDEEVPKVDFDKEVILVAAGPGPNILRVEGPVLSDKGDLKFGWSITERAGDGFVGVILKVSREEVKTVNGMDPPKE